jgi:hypothetical protein
MDIRNHGQLRANPNASGDNTLRIQKCGASNSCEDIVTGSTVETGDTLVSFVFGGVTYTLEEPIAVDNPSAVQAAIYAILEKEEVYPVLEVSWESDSLDVRHIGGAALSALTFTTAGAVALTRNCTVAVLCDNTFFTTGDDAKVLKVGEDTYTLSGNAWTGTPATDATTAGTLKTEIEAAVDGIATVEVNNVSEGFDITLRAKQSLAVTFNGNTVDRCCCKQEFIA